MENLYESKRTGYTQQLSYSRVWETPTDDPERKSAHIIHVDLSRISILFPNPHSCPEIDHA